MASLPDVDVLQLTPKILGLKGTKQAETSEKIYPFNRRWHVDGAIYGRATSHFYFLDPARQEQNETILSGVKSREFVLIAGSQASGKTTRLFRLEELLEEMGYECLYFTIQRVHQLNDTNAFWSSIGRVLQRVCNLPFSISSPETFIEVFEAASWNWPVVLLIDELSRLSLATEEVRNSFFKTLHKIQHSQRESAIASVIAAGTFSAISLTTTNSSSSPFKFSTVIQSPFFSLEETKQLFDVFARDNYLFIEKDVIDQIWDLSNGHPGAVCACGRIISDNLSSLCESMTISFDSWRRFSLTRLHVEIVYYDPFRSMTRALRAAEAGPAVQLYRLLFSGFLEEVEVNSDEEALADWLVLEGVLLRPDPSVRKYRATSPLTDGVIRNRVLVNRGF